MRGYNKADHSQVIWTRGFVGPASLKSRNSRKNPKFGRKPPEPAITISGTVN